MLPSKMSSRKHKRSTVGDSLPPAKRESRTGTKRPHPSDDEDYGTEEEHELTQLQSQDLKEGVLSFEEAEAGVLDKVELIDFMCHQHLELNLSPNVNFILGRNGSGKSAIMTGIVVALGGKARSTERGSSLKQFIRTGANSSTVVVHLRNRGSEAYKPEEYGDTIICERTIRNDGTSCYKIKSHLGKTVTTKKEELVAITDHCNIQIDNPVSLLNQDTSRNFLHNSKPNAKYKLFMKATHLEQIAIDYQQSEEEQKLMEQRIETMAANLPALRNEAKKLEERVESFERFSEMEDKIDQLENELKWAIVMEMEALIPPIENDIRKEQGRIPRNESKAKNAQNALDVARQEVHTAEEGLHKVADEAQKLRKERESISMEKRKKAAELRQNTSFLGQIRKGIGEAKKEKAAFEKAKQESILASQRDVKGEREARIREIEEVEEKLRRVEGEIATADAEKAQFLAACKRKDAEFKAHRSKESAMEGQINTCQDQLKRLLSSRNDNLAAYGEDMRTLVNELQRQRGKFRHLPKGPIGSKISLQSYKWSIAVEQAIKRGTLIAFVVDNLEDAKVFKAIVQRTVRRGLIPEAIVSRFQGTVYDVRAKRAQSSHPTVYDMLIVPDPDVMNVLIDQCHVENVLLIEQRTVANHIITDERPQFASEAYTLEGDLVLNGRHYSNKSRPFGFIKESLESTIREEEYRLRELKTELQQLKQEGQSIKAEADTNRRHETELGQKIRRKIEEKKKLSMHLMQLRNAKEEEEPEEDIATYDSEIAELEGQIAAKESERLAQEEVVSKVKEELEEINQRSRQIDHKVDQVTAHHEELSARLGENENNKKQAEKRLKTYQDKITEIKVSIASLEENLQKRREEVQEAVAAAEESCERVETDKSRKDITSEIKQLKQHINKDQPSVEEQEAVKKACAEAYEKFIEHQFTHKKLKKALKELKKSLNDRVENYKRLQERVATRASHYFTFFLRQRDYDGKLKFNHPKEQLIIEVKVDSHTQQSQATSNARQLSGGERSYTTVCFIMALWDAIQAPFRCLDEFDVFMDMLNRKISMKMLMELAEDKPTRQFIFFTPQDMSSMGLTGKMVKVLRLQEPVRGGQTTLNFTGTS